MFFKVTYQTTSLGNSQGEIYSGDGNMCSEDQYGCILTAECIPISWLCDNEIDCPDGSDEEYCTGKIRNMVYKHVFVKNALLMFTFNRRK